jgi:hypothetical protein
MKILAQVFCGTFCDSNQQKIILMIEFLDALFTATIVPHRLSIDSHHISATNNTCNCILHIALTLYITTAKN